MPDHSFGGRTLRKLSPANLRRPLKLGVTLCILYCLTYLGRNFARFRSMCCEAGSMLCQQDSIHRRDERRNVTPVDAVTLRLEAERSLHIGSDGHAEIRPQSSWRSLCRKRVAMQHGMSAIVLACAEMAAVSTSSVSDLQPWMLTTAQPVGSTSFAEKSASAY